MLLLIDTCFWKHAFDLFNRRLVDIRPIRLKQTIGLTKSIIEEIIHFKLDKFVPLNAVSIIPFQKKTIAINILIFPIWGTKI